MSSGDPKLGSIVEIRIKVNNEHTIQRGTLRFWGATDFAPGKWAGIELSAPYGKNNGTVQGIKYFTCQPNHGVFIKPSQVTIVSNEAEPKLAAAAVPAQEARSTITPPLSNVCVTQSHLNFACDLCSAQCRAFPHNRGPPKNIKHWSD